MTSEANWEEVKWKKVVLHRTWRVYAICHVATRTTARWSMRGSTL